MAWNRWFPAAANLPPEQDIEWACLCYQQREWEDAVGHWPIDRDYVPDFVSHFSSAQSSFTMENESLPQRSKSNRAVRRG
jgi:hypothetical protein